MSLFWLGIIGLVCAFILVFLRMPIAFAFAFAGFIGIWIVRGLKPAFEAIGSVPFATMSMYVWSVVPLFTFMGYLAFHTNLAGEFYEGIRKWVGQVRGGLAMTVILGNTGFGACTGDPVSACVTFTAISLPQMRRYHYDDKLTLGCVAAGSILAGMIPPSMGYILYGALTETSIGQLFMGGVFPGLILAGLYCGIIFVRCRLNPQLGPPGPKTTWKEKMGAGTGMYALIIVFVVIIGGIFVGLFTPTEAGAAGAMVVLIIGLIRRRLSWNLFKTTLREASIATGMVGLLLVACMVLNTFLVVTQVPRTIADIISSMTNDPKVAIGIITGVLLILGCFIDGLALVLIMTPILYPIVTAMGVDPVHYGILQGMAIGCGGLTPPFGILVYACVGTAKDVPLFDVFKGAAPMLAANLTNLVIVLFIPQLALFLPGLMFPAMK